VDSTGFAQVEGDPGLTFPAAQGPHPDYQTEWWYYTGNLHTADGRQFGYQLTFFRRALEPANLRSSRASGWAAEQIYMGHFAVTDVTGGQHVEFERLSRGAAGLAGAQADPYHVWLEDWTVEQTSPDQYRITAQEEGIALDLTLVEGKPPALHGKQGYSQKGPEAGNASAYYSQTRLLAEGTIMVDGKTFPVTGLSWMDHEYSTSALSDGQIGWDWFSLQLDDNTELMLYQIRRADGSIDPYSRGSYIDAESQVAALDRLAGNFEIAVLGEWTSPASGAVYPSGWRVTLPEYGLDLTLEPLLDDQEMNLSTVYWEGAVRISGTRNGTAISGMGYVELTGYDGSLEGQF
jgi:predicted secreted hydrolase